MSTNDTWMPLYLGDYLADTMHLTTAQHGAYLLLLMHYWRNGPLADEDAQLAAIARCDAKAWKGIGPIVRGFFRATDGFLHQKRMDHERNRWSSISDKRREAGRAGAEAKWQPDKAPPPPKPNGKAMTNTEQIDGKRMANAIDVPSQNPGLDGKCHDFAIPPLPLPKEEKVNNLLTFKQETHAGAREEGAVSAENSATPTDGLVSGLTKSLRHVEYAPGAYQPIKPEGYKHAAEILLETQRRQPKPSYLPREQINQALQAPAIPVVAMAEPSRQPIGPDRYQAGVAKPTEQRRPATGYLSPEQLRMVRTRRRQ